MIRRTFARSATVAGDGTAEVVLGPPDTPGDWFVERIHHMCVPPTAPDVIEPAVAVYAGRYADNKVPREASADGNFDVAECVVPIWLSMGTELTLRWTGAPPGARVTADVQYTQGED